MAAQLYHLSIVVNISTADSDAIALPYDRMAGKFLAEKARSRREINSSAFFSGFFWNLESTRDSPNSPVIEYAIGPDTFCSK